MPVDFNIQQPNFAPIAGIGQTYAEGQQKKEQRSKQQALIGQAQEMFRSGNMDKMAEFAIANPTLGRTMFEFGGIRDEAAQQRMAGLAKNLTISPAPMQDLQQYIAQGEAQGRDMTHSKKMLENSGGDPKQLQKIAELGWLSNDPQGFKVYQSTKPKAIESMTEYQQAMVKGKEADQEIRMLELDNKKAERQLSRETDALKRQELEQKIEINKQKSEAARVKSEAGKVANQEKVQAGIDSSRDFLSQAEGILGNEDWIDSLTGVRGATPLTTPGTSAWDAGVAFDQFTNSMTLENLGKMSGVLTDRDIQVLRSAAGGLERGMSDKAFKNRLKTIVNKVKAKLSAAEKSAPKKKPADMSDEELLNKYGG